MALEAAAAGAAVDGGARRHGMATRLPATGVAHVTRAAARRSYAVDQSVFEFEPNGKAATEFSAVYKFSCSHENRGPTKPKLWKEARHA